MTSESLPPAPRIKRHFSVVVHDADNVELRHGAFNAVSHFLGDENKAGVLARIVQLLDGRSAKEVADGAGVSRAKVESVVDHLIQIRAVDESPGSALDAYFECAISSLRTAETGIKPRLPVTVFAAGALAEIIVDSIRNLMPDSQIETVEPESALAKAFDLLKLADFDGALAAPTIERTFDHLRGRFIVFPQALANPHAALVMNRLALALGSPWLWGAFDGPALFVGPLTVPGVACCFQCFETRVMMNLREYASYQRYKTALAEGRASAQQLPIQTALYHVLGGHLAMEAVNFLVTGTGFTIGKALCLYLPTMEFSFNDILRVPHCPACAPRAYVSDPELYFDIRAVLAKGNPT